jgi:hypothetical protein
MSDSRQVSQLFLSLDGVEVTALCQCCRAPINGPLQILLAYREGLPAVIFTVPIDGTAHTVGWTRITNIPWEENGNANSPATPGT